MDYNKAKRFLEKIQREMDRMSAHNGSVSRLDRDILLDYIRDLYDAVLTEEAAPRKAAAPVSTPAPSPVPAAVVAPAHVPVSGPKQVSLTDNPAPAVKIPTPTPAPVAPPAAPPIIEPVAAPVAVVPSAPKFVPVEPTPVVAEPIALPKVKTPEPISTPTAVASAAQKEDAPEILAIFEVGKAKELSDKLVQPTKDIWKSIGINDRILYGRELFGGDNATFQQVVEALNMLTDFEDAKRLLIQNVAPKYKWGEDRRVEFAKEFVRLVRRRYL